MSSILLTCRDPHRLERSYVPALQQQGWTGEIRIARAGDPLPSLDGVAGLLLSGGGDIHPRNWDAGEAPHPTAEVDEERDALELPLAREAWERGLPILGICRGEQLLNVALGGSLIQDIPSHFGCPADLHSHGTPDVPELRHAVEIDPASRLAALLGATAVDVNSRHHQTARRLAPGLRAVAWHPETRGDEGPLVEGLEALDPRRWVIGVQWHPENLVGLEDGAGQAARRIFRAFAEAVARTKAESERTDFSSGLPGASGSPRWP